MPWGGGAQPTETVAREERDEDSVSETGGASVCSVAFSYTLNIAGATFEMPDYCLLVVNSRRGRDLGPPRPDTFRSGSSGESGRQGRRDCKRYVLRVSVQFMFSTIS